MRTAVVLALATLILVAPAASAQPPDPIEELMETGDALTDMQCNHNPDAWYQYCQPLVDCVNRVFDPTETCRRPG